MMTIAPKRQNTLLRRRSTHIWDDQGQNGSRSNVAPPLSQPTLSYGSEVEVEKSLMAGNLYNSSSSLASSPNSSPHKPIAAAANLSRRMSTNDVQMIDGTKPQSKRGKTSGKSPRSRAQNQNKSDYQIFIESSQSQSQPQSQDSRRLRRTLSNISNASTILIDPDLDQCIEKLDKRGIKYHDYASDPLSSHSLHQIPETFDPYEAIAEFEYKLHQNPRNRAIPGKVIRRLLQYGWITMDEVQARCSPDDMESLRQWDQKGGYPHVLRFPEDQHPPITRQQRIWVLLQKRRLYQRMDRAADETRKDEENRLAHLRESENRLARLRVSENRQVIQETWVQEQQKRTTKAQARASSKSKAASPPNRTTKGKEDVKAKRRLEGSSGGAEIERGLTSPKRVCLSVPPSPTTTEPVLEKEPRIKKVWSDTYWFEVEARLGVDDWDHSERFWAPRSVYDSEVYFDPEFAQSQPSDGPSIYDGFSQSQSSQSQSQPARPRKPVPLVHPKKGKGLQRGGLSRQQTLVAF